MLRRAGSAVLVLLVSCLLAAPLVAYQVHRYRAVNPVDEAADLDYLHRLDAHGQLVVGQGTAVDAYTARVVACRGIGFDLLYDDVSYLVPPDPSACAGRTGLLYSGRDTADIDPPTYYLATDAGVRVLRAFGYDGDLLDAGRWVGVFWGGLSVALTYLLARLLGASRTGAGLGGLALLTTSGAYAYWAMVNPHATDVAAGAGAAVVAVLWLQRRAPSVALLAAGAVPVALKGSDLVVSVLVVVAALVVAVRGVVARDPTRVRRGLAGAAWAVLGTAVVSALVLAAKQAYEISGTPDFDDMLHASSLQLSQVLGAIGVFARSPDAGGGVGVWVWSLGATVLFATTVGPRLVRSAPAVDDDARRDLATALLPVVVFGAVVFVLSDFVLQHQYHLIRPRYGLSLLPVVLAYGAAALHSRWAQAGAVLLVAVGAYAVVTPLVG